MVSIEVWRSRIGGFNQGNACSNGVYNHTLVVKLLWKCLAAQALLLLLVMGGIELNPGPTIFSFLCPERGCLFTTLNAKTHVAHQKVHSMNSNFTFKCPVPTCSAPRFGTYNAAYQHVHTNHCKQASIQTGQHSTGLSRFSCSIADTCIATSFHTQYDICQHVIDHLSKSEGLPIMCPLKCVVSNTEGERTPQFSAVSVFRTHLSVKHRGWKLSDGSNVPTSSTSVQQPPQDFAVHHNADDNDLGLGFIADNDDEFYDAEDDSDDAMFSFDNVVSSIAKFYLMLEGHLFLPTSTINIISKHIAFLSELSQISVEKVLKKEMERLQLTSEKSNQIVKRVLLADPVFASHHPHCEGPTFISDSRRRNYYKEKFGYVDVVQLNVNPRDLDAGKFAHYVKVEQTLKVVLADEDVQKQISQSFNNPVEFRDIISDYTDGSTHREDEPVLQKCIDLVFFIDAFNMVNPLGAAKNLYKTVGVYMSILNLKPFNRAKLEAMHLVMLVQEKVFEACDHKKCIFSCSHLKCFKDLIGELNRLYSNGINFLGQQIPVRLKFVVGDSLGAHQVGGLLRNFSLSKYFCRFCEISRAEFQAEPHRKLGIARTQENIAQHVQRLRLRRLAGQRAKSHGGVRMESVLNRIKRFHVTKPGLPPCLGHDLFEGVATWDLKFVINHCIAKNWFTLDEFIARLKGFKCQGYDAGNKPKSISKKKKKGLGLHAVQVWFILRLLPLLIGDKITDKEDEVWKFYLQLKEMTEYICAPRLRREQVEEMRTAIFSYMNERKRLQLRFKPKNHFLLHYADMFLKLGPLIFLWGMRFESFHSLFKRIAIQSRNFKNITLTMARKYQLRLCYQSTGPLIKSGTILSTDSTKLSVKSFDQKTAALIQHAFTSDALVMDKIKVGDLNITSKMWLLLGCKEGKIHLGQIIAIVSDGEDSRLIMKTEVYAEIIQNLGIYKFTQIGDGRQLRSLSEIESLAVQPVYKFKTNYYFSLKYKLLDMIRQVQV